VNDSLLRASLLDLLHALGNDAQGALATRLRLTLATERGYTPIVPLWLHNGPCATTAHGSVSKPAPLRSTSVPRMPMYIMYAIGLTSPDQGT